MNDEFGLTLLIEDFDNFSSSYRDNYSKVSDRTNDFTKELGNIEFLNKADAEMAVSILQDSYSDVRLKEPENEKYPFYFVYYSNIIEEKKKSDELSDFTPNFDLEATPLGNWSSFDAPVGEELEEDMEIKRYSDVVPKENRKYWYFTTHGVGPGSIPKGVNVLEIKDGKNDKGTSGTFVCLDAILNTDELKKYDMREMKPTDESLDESISTYSVVDLETGDKFGAYEDLSYAKTKAYQYMNMFGNKEMAIVDTDTNKPITKVSSKKSVSEDMFGMEDSYFSREQLDEFEEVVQDELGTTSAQIYKVYWEPGNILEVDWEYMGYEETTVIKVDMRGIRTIRDLERKYALKVVDDIHERCEEFERDSFSDLYDESVESLDESYDRVVGGHIITFNIKKLPYGYRVTGERYNGSYVASKEFETREEAVKYIKGVGEPYKKSKNESVEKHDILNQKIFNGDELDPEVKDKLLEIVDRFKYNLEENDIKLDIKDVRIIGSNASYNYTDKSDIDLHIFADLSVYPDQEVLLQKVYDAYKALWNSKYDPVIRGHEVEIYVEPYTGD